MNRVLLVSLGTVLGLTSGCSVVPETGRWRMMLISRDEEEKAGREIWKITIRCFPTSPNREAAAIAKRLTQRLARASPASEEPWDCQLLQCPLPQACCLPNNRVVIYDALLPAAENEAGLAIIIGHEIAHLVCRHNAEQASEERNPLALWGLLSAHEVWEDEADRLGLIYAARAGYDPTEANALFDRLGVDRWRPALSNYPRGVFMIRISERRRCNLKKYLPEAEVVYRAAAHQYGRGERLPLDQPGAPDKPDEDKHPAWREELRAKYVSNVN